MNEETFTWAGRYSKAFLNSPTSPNTWPKNLRTGIKEPTVSLTAPDHQGCGVCQEFRPRGKTPECKPSAAEAHCPAFSSGVPLSSLQLRRPTVQASTVRPTVQPSAEENPLSSLQPRRPTLQPSAEEAHCTAFSCEACDESSMSASPPVAPLPPVRLSQCCPLAMAWVWKAHQLSPSMSAELHCHWEGDCY